MDYRFVGCSYRTQIKPVCGRPMTSLDNYPKFHELIGQRRFSKNNVQCVFFNMFQFIVRLRSSLCLDGERFRRRSYCPA